MKYELRPDQSLGENLRQIFRQQINGALALARGEKEAGDTLVHDIRKHLKKARAVLRLVRKEIGNGALRRQDRRLRNAGRLMTEIRDAEVRLETMRQLEEGTHHHYRSYQKIEKVLAAELENFLAAFGGWEKKAVPLLEHADQLGKKWPVSGYREQELRRAVRRTYKSGRRALAKVQKELSSANIHELRKQVKLLGYQVGILRPWNEVVIGELLRELTELGHLLGRVHDLTFLADRLRLERGERHWGKQDDELLAVIEKTEAELQRDGVEIAERFFAERRAEFGLHIDEWFEDSRQTNTDSVAESLLTA
jgi:CHAD domain-containing protein